jgi:hypothetical protein
MSHDFLQRSHEIGGFSRQKEGAQETLSQGSGISGGARGGPSLRATERGGGEGTTAREPRGAGEATARYGYGGKK